MLRRYQKVAKDLVVSLAYQVRTEDGGWLMSLR